MENFGERIQEVLNGSNEDGFCYPPAQKGVGYSWEGLASKAAAPVKRPALLYRIPATHKIIFSNSEKMGLEDLRKGKSGFILHLLAFLSGHQGQFFDWWVTGRFRVHPHEPFGVNLKTVQALVTKAEKLWEMLEPVAKSRLTTLFFCRNRLHVYEWPWEEFAFGYMVLDGIWKWHAQTGGPGVNVPHGERINALCKRRGLMVDEDAAQKITKIRGDLFHETIWSGDTPGMGAGTMGFEALFLLKRLLDQLLVRCIGYEGYLPPWTIRASYSLQ